MYLSSNVLLHKRRGPKICKKSGNHKKGEKDRKKKNKQTNKNKKKPKKTTTHTKKNNNVKYKKLIVDVLSLCSLTKCPPLRDRIIYY